MTGAAIRESRVFTQAEFDRFAAISGDDNPIHVDPAFSAGTRFGRTVAHGMLLYTALWALIRREFPSAVQETQDLMFPEPTFADERMRLEIDVVGGPAPDIRELAVRVVAEADGKVTLAGRARIRLTAGGRR